MTVEDHTISFSLEVNVAKAYEDIRRVQTLLYRTITLLRRMGLPEEVDAAITKIQRLIMILNQLRLTIAALEVAAGPIGWALLGISVATTAWNTYDFIEYDLRGR